jgi:hypothetical protein
VEHGSLLVVRPTVRPIVRDGRPEHAGLGKLDFRAEADAHKVDVALGGRPVECPAPALKRGGRQSRAAAFVIAV